jgi:hypothetical protein
MSPSQEHQQGEAVGVFHHQVVDKLVICLHVLTMVERRERRRRPALTYRIFPAVLVSFQLRKLQRHLWLAGSRHRPHDVDVLDHRALRRGAQF